MYMIYMIILTIMYILKLEAKAGLEFHHATREGTLRPAEIGIVDVWREEPKRRQVQVIESIEEICLHFKKRTFTEKRRHASSLRHTQVDCEVSWTTERIAANARR